MSRKIGSINPSLNRRLAAALVERAAHNGAHLILFAEFMPQGYCGRLAGHKLRPESRQDMPESVHNPIYDTIFNGVIEVTRLVSLKSLRVLAEITPVLLLLFGFFWYAFWRVSDTDMLRKAVIDPDQATIVAPLWIGRDRIQYADLSRETRAKRDQATFASLRTWADVCRSFTSVQVPTGRLTNGWVIPPMSMGDGWIRAVEVIVVEEWSGWKLATFRCSPGERRQ